MNIYTLGKPSSKLLNSFAHIYNDIKNKKSPDAVNMMVLTSLFSSKPINLWLVDDDYDDCSMFTEAMSQISSNIHVTVYHDGGSFFQSIDNTPDNGFPEIIFLDLNLPITDGKECLDKLKSNKRTKDIPVVIYSTSSYPTDIEDTFKKGASHYISKPDSFSTLLQLFKKVLHIELDEDSEPSFDKFVIRA